MADRTAHRYMSLRTDHRMGRSVALEHPTLLFRVSHLLSRTNRQSNGTWPRALVEMVIRMAAGLGEGRRKGGGRGGRDGCGGRGRRWMWRMREAMDAADAGMRWMRWMRGRDRWGGCGDMWMWSRGA